MIVSINVTQAWIQLFMHLIDVEQEKQQEIDRCAYKVLDPITLSVKKLYELSASKANNRLLHFKRLHFLYSIGDLTEKSNVPNLIRFQVAFFTIPEQTEILFSARANVFSGD